MVVGPQRLMLALLMSASLLAGCSDADAEPEELEIDVEVEATETTGVIRGVVVDEAIRPIAGATVRLKTLDPQATVTTAVGAFGFEDLEPGTYFLDIEMLGYASVQTSAEVVAGVSEPDPVRVMLTAVYTGTPNFETLKLVMHLSGSGWVDGVGGVTCCYIDGFNRSWFFDMDFSANGTWFVQTITTWEPNVALSETARIEIEASSGDDSLGENLTYSASPSVSEFHKDELADMTDPIHLFGSIFAYPTAPLPIALSVEQDYTVYAIAFNNFDPPANYRFDRDGNPETP
jgi:hypothetical protein